MKGEKWRTHRRAWLIKPFSFYFLLFTFAFLLGCSTPTAEFAPQPIPISLTADGDTRQLTTTAATVRQFLEEAQLELSPTDEVTPPLFTPLTADMAVRVVRVTESIELIEQSIPFERKIIRNEAMAADAPPVIIQGGRAGLEELTLRIVYRDGLEAERRITQVTLLSASQDEIVMLGLGSGLTTRNVTFGGLLAYISGGSNAVLLRGETALPEFLPIGGELDGRVFALSPTGSHLLYTRVPTDTADTTLFNSLWVISTERGRAPQPLAVNNVLWADWNPSQTSPLQIGYTTALATNLPPGWEANNDLWVGDLATSGRLEAQKLVDSYPATYGWWGGHYAWSPNGRFMAYSYADEVGIIDVAALREEAETAAQATPTASTPTPAPEGISARQALQRFTAYETRADWVWLPSLSWSPDGRYLAFTQHASPTSGLSEFDLWVVDVQGGVSGRLVPQAGIWGYPRWSPLTADEQSGVAHLRATEAQDSLRSGYVLWLMDGDGSNGRQIYPPLGETSYFGREEQFLAWGSSGQDVAFIFNNDLYLLNLQTGESFRVTQGEGVASQPTWAPYGAGATAELSSIQANEVPTEPEVEP